jgi:hypothetical protein
VDTTFSKKQGIRSIGYCVRNNDQGFITAHANRRYAKMSTIEGEATAIIQSIKCVFGMAFGS